MKTPFGPYTLLVPLALVAILLLLVMLNRQAVPSPSASRVDTTQVMSVTHAQQQQTVVTPYPTGVDALAERRAEASAFAADDPERKDASIIPMITEYLLDPDAVVQTAGAAAVARIAMAGEAAQSGLRLAVRNDQALQAALFDTISMTTAMLMKGREGDELREIAIGAIFYLYLDAPSIEVEQAMITLYWDEIADNVRFAIVEALCGHEYSSQDTRGVLENAVDAYDDQLASAAQECLATLP